MNVLFPAEISSGDFYYLVPLKGRLASEVLSGALRGNDQAVPLSLRTT
jgi:hypothetical protein